MAENKAPGRAGGRIAAIAAIVLTCFYPCLFMYAQNAGEAKAVDMLPFFGIFLLTAAAGLLICLAVFRNLSRAAFLTCLGMLVCINFSMILQAVHRRFAWLGGNLLLVLFAAVLIALLILLLQKKPDMTPWCIIIAITFGALSLISLLTALPQMITSVRETQRVEQRGPGEYTPEADFTGEKRNFYYLLFDEFGGQENLETYFDYDSEDFYTELEARGFSVSRTTRNTESVWTDTLIPNLLNLDYVADDSMPEKVRRAYLEEPALLNIFRQNGYAVNLINHRDYLRMQGVQELTTGQTEDNISEYLFNNSIYCRLPGISERITYWMFQNYRDNYKEPLENAIDCLKSSAQAVGDAPTLTLSYIQCPHAPFVYAADGTVQDITQNGWNWKDRSLYLGQLQYMEGVILDTIDSIRAEDPEAVIVLLSDHGARVPLHMVEQYGGPRFDSEKETPVMQSALLAVSIPGQELDVEGDTGVNAVRRTLDAAYGTSLGTVAVPEGYVTAEIYNAKSDDSGDAASGSTDEQD